MLKPQDVTTATEIIFGPEKTASKFGGETLAILLNPDTHDADFLMFCATSAGTWKEISRAVVAAIAANPKEPWHLSSMFRVYLHKPLLGLENREDICHDPHPEFIAGCFLGLFEAGIWIGKWEKENSICHSMYIDSLFGIIREALLSTNGFMEKAGPCLDDRYRSELTGTIKRYLSDPLDADTLFRGPGFRFSHAEDLLRDIAEYAEKGKRTLSKLAGMIVDGLTYGVLGFLSPLGRAQLIALAPKRYSTREEEGLWKFAK